MATDWAKLTVAKLKEECEERDLETSGKKADLVKRLQDHDAGDSDKKVEKTDAAADEAEVDGDDSQEKTPKKRGRKRASSTKSEESTPTGGKKSTPTKKTTPSKDDDDDDAGDESNSDDEDAEPPKKVARSESQSKLKRKSSSLKDYGKIEVSSLPYGPAAANRFKIVSWNVNGLRSVLKGESLFAKYLRSEEADVVCVQETKLQEKDVAGLDIKSIAGDIYPHRYFSCSTEKKGYAGTAIFSKIKPLSTEIGIGQKKHDGEGRVITLEFEKFYLVASYTVNSGQKLERLSYRTTSWDKDFFAFLQKLDQKKPVVWTGDLNVAHHEVDIAEPKTNKKSAGFTVEERDSFSSMLNEGKLIDSFRHLNPDRTHCYTYWSMRSNCKEMNKGWRLDYFIVSERFMSSVEDSFIRGNVDGSDHCPIGLLIKTEA